MTVKPKILAFAGSLRKDSFNKKLIKIAIKGAERAGAEVTYIDLLDYPLPLLNQDEEALHGLPKNAVTLKQLMWASDGFLIASPEYNSSISGVLKNTIDWTSRQLNKDEENLSCFKGKFAGIMSASPGALGGLRGLVHLRAILENIYVTVIPQQKSIPQAMNVFDEAGNLKEPKQILEVEEIGAALAKILIKVKS